MSDRPALLFLPGLICDERIWRDEARALAGMARTPERTTGLIRDFLDRL